MKRKTIGVTRFREKGFALLNDVGPEGIIITKHGKPVAKLVPIQANSADLIGSLKNRIKIHGDILGTGIIWDARA